MSNSENIKQVAIIGAGFGGIGLGIRLHRAGIRDFVILEKSNSIGGVWRDNTYPGAACDVPSRLYSYSFEQSWPWQSRFGRQSEILGYLNHCADKYDVTDHIRLETQVTSACFDDEMGLWRVALSSGETILVRVLVSGVGIFNQPIVPDIPGRATFAGPSFHSSEWNHAIDLSGRRVAVIGTGASAIQFVPEIAKVAGQLHVCHRSPQYVRPRDERVMGRRPRDRWDILREFDNGTARRYSDELAAEARTAWLHYLTTEVPDPALRAKLTPQYPFGCKRMLQSNDWYPALQRPNVELIDVPVEQITQDALRTSDGVTRNVDVIIYGTGFRPTAYLPHLHITGRAAGRVGPGHTPRDVGIRRRWAVPGEACRERAACRSANRRRRSRADRDAWRSRLLHPAPESKGARRGAGAGHPRRGQNPHPSGRGDTGGERELPLSRNG